MVAQVDCNEELSRYLQEMNQNYDSTIKEIPLFSSTQSIQWTDERKKAFAAVFYHLRGHFANFMWYVANFSSDDGFKKIILQNYAEEIGLNQKKSHEALYSDFAKECGIDIQDEIVEQTNNFDIARNFNSSHIRWLSKHSEIARFAAFSAYERLDNIDYPFLLNVASQFNLNDDALTFFRVHIHVEHFDSTFPLLEQFWLKAENDVKVAFDFIYSTQLAMWQQFSAYISQLDD